jgi:hypothetical protein
MWLVGSARARREGNRCAVPAIEDGDGHGQRDVERFGDLDNARGRSDEGYG